MTCSLADPTINMRIYCPQYRKSCWCWLDIFLRCTYSKVFFHHVLIIWTRVYFETVSLLIESPTFHSQCEKVAYIIGTIRHIFLSKADCHATIKWFISSKFREKQPEMAFYIGNETAILYFLSKCVLQNHCKKGIFILPNRLNFRDGVSNRISLTDLSEIISLPFYLQVGAIEELVCTRIWLFLWVSAGSNPDPIGSAGKLEPHLDPYLHQSEKLDPNRIRIRIKVEIKEFLRLKMESWRWYIGALEGL